MARTISGENICPVEVGFKSGKPVYSDEYTKVFGSKVLFGQTDNYMVLNRKVADIPVLFPNDNLLQYFESYAKEFLSEIEPIHSITYKTKKLILSFMDSETLSIKRIAQELSISVRRLQSNLHNEGTDFNKSHKQTREQLAKKYLHENYSIEDITYLLGFSDPSVFRKAFKKWLGITAKEYREQSNTCS